VKITHDIGKIITRIDGASNQRRKLQINKNYKPSKSPGYVEVENLVSAFVYNAVGINKIATAFLAKPPP